MVILGETEIRGLVDLDQARVAIAAAFQALQAGEATLAGVISLPFSRPAGLAHVKAGHLHTDAVWTVKVATDFEPDDGGATTHNGLMLVLSALDGSLVATLVDNGFLTELRTGAAGAVAAELLSRPDARAVAIVGAGSQARHQLAALLRVRPIDDVRVASRSRDRAEAFVAEVEERHGLRPRLCDSIEEAVRGADIVVTATQSTSPLVEAAWLEPGVHLTAVGSDEPSKQELAPDVLARADVVAVDDRGQAARFGELHHAIDRGLLTAEQTVTIGELLLGQAPGRCTDTEITVADLTGVGVQDAAIAAVVMRAAAARQDRQLEPREGRTS